MTIEERAKRCCKDVLDDDSGYSIPGIIRHALDEQHKESYAAGLEDAAEVVKGLYELSKYGRRVAVEAIPGEGHSMSALSSAWFASEGKREQARKERVDDGDGSIESLQLSAMMEGDLVRLVGILNRLEQIQVQMVR